MDKEVNAGNSEFMLKAVIFDFDGTIGDTLKLVIESIREAVSPFMDRELSDDEIADTFGPIEEYLLPTHVVIVNLYLILKYLHHYY